MAANSLGCIKKKPTPDWKGGAAVAKAMEAKAETLESGFAYKSWSKKREKLKNYLRSIDAGDAAVILSMIMLTSSTKIPVKRSMLSIMYC